MNQKKINHILVLIYAHPEFYPPTLAAIQELSTIAERIDVVTRKMTVSRWDYPDNVRIHHVNETNYNGFEIERVSFAKKISHFLEFVLKSRKLLTNEQSDWVLAYDAIGLYGASFLHKRMKRQGTKLWYHNHDVTDLKNAGKFSLIRRANEKEKFYFKSIDLFSLPAHERLIHFPVNELKAEPLILPNYPLRSFYGKYSSTRTEVKNPIKFVFQGSIGSGHGLEEIIKLLNSKVSGRELELHLVGKIRDPYLKKLRELAISSQTEKRLYYHGMKSFAELPEFLSQFDVGLAIHLPYNVTYSTGGSASNKIYEYAALGLPVILYDNEHYREYLGDKHWAFFTEISEDRLLNTFKSIVDSYQPATKAAILDFNKNFNFEAHFLKFVESKL